jgi:hypothetical protein
MQNVRREISPPFGKRNFGMDPPFFTQVGGSTTPRILPEFLNDFCPNRIPFNRYPSIKYSALIAFYCFMDIKARMFSKGTVLGKSHPRVRM